MSGVVPLPCPEKLRSVEEALGAARNAELGNIVIVGEVPEGFLILNAGDGEPLTAAQVVFLLAKAQHLILDGYGR